MDKKLGLQKLLNGEKHIIATASRREYTVGLVEPGEPMFLFKKGWPEPVPSGKWMGWPEDEWGIDEGKWEQMSLGRKAELEVREQADKWIHLEYYQEWLDMYAPNVFIILWFQNKLDVCEEKARKIRAEGGSELNNYVLKLSKYQGEGNEFNGFKYKSS